jgi:crossover junction endodeoxyribonuclease RuvC
MFTTRLIHAPEHDFFVLLKINSRIPGDSPAMAGLFSCFENFVLIRTSTYGIIIKLDVIDMRILGIDPGIATVGFAVVDFNKSKYNLLKCGVITTPAHTSLSSRLNQIYDDMSDLLTSFKPDCVSVEELFFNTNITTGISVAHGRGVILLAAYRANVPIYEYTPLQVKQAVVGYGRAEKKQVMDMVRRICNLKAVPKPDDAADAVALALCHARSATSLLNKGDISECSTI